MSADAVILGWEVTVGYEGNIWGSFWESLGLSNASICYSSVLVSIPLFLLHWLLCFLPIVMFLSYLNELRGCYPVSSIIQSKEFYQ